MLSEWLALGTFRKQDFNVPIVSPKDIYHYVRLDFGAWWIAGGERIADSIWRRAMMKKSGSIEEKRGRVYPVAHFTKQDVMRYIKHRKLKISPEAKWLGHSFRSLEPEEMFLVRRHYPADFERIRRWFPFVEAGVAQFEQDLRENGKEGLIGDDGITRGWL
jgi:phosphoadenosine phosphosulfate reductase